MLFIRYSIMLLACFAVFPPDAACADQKQRDNVLQNDTQMISGKVTDVITAAGFTYAEVDTGNKTVWAAGPGLTPLSKGDKVTFSADMPMQDFHSNALGRDFSVIYFIQHYITDKETLSIAAPRGLVKQQQKNKSTSKTPAGKPGEVEIGGYLREAALDGLNGKAKKFSDFRGKPLIINVWASWCGPCRAEMGSLQRLAQRYNGKEFNVIGISTDDYRDKAEAFIDNTQISFENFIDHRLLLENMLGANTIPLTVLVGADGRVLEKVRGAREWDSPEIVDAIGETFHISLMH